MEKPPRRLLPLCSCPGRLEARLFDWRSTTRSSFRKRTGGQDSPFVIEGDEYDSAFFDKRSKFIHYRPKVLVMNNLEFDHGDIFRDLQDISRSFSHLLRIVPSDGFVLRNGDDPNLLALPDATWTRIISVGVGENNEFRITDFTEESGGHTVQNWFSISHGKGNPLFRSTGGCPASSTNARNAGRTLPCSEPFIVRRKFLKIKGFMAILASGLSQQIAKADGVFDLTK